MTQSISIINYIDFIQCISDLSIQEIVKKPCIKSSAKTALPVNRIIRLMHGLNEIMIHMSGNPVEQIMLLVHYITEITADN